MKIASKCIALGMKCFKNESKNERYVPLSNFVSSPFNLGLLIDGQLIKLNVNPAEKDPFKAYHFKFLGRWLNPSLKRTSKSEFLAHFLVTWKLFRNQKTMDL